MKKLILPVLLFFMASVLWAMPPMPGSGLTHDGSLRWEPAASDSEGSLPLRAPSAERASKSSSVSTTGTKNILVILAQFPAGEGTRSTYTKLSFQSAHNAAYYENLLGDYTNPAPAGLTMAEYYKKMSRGKLGLQFQVLGPYTANYDYAFYGVNNIYGNDTYPFILVYEMLEKARKSGEVAGNIDNCTVIVVHAGPGEENGGVTTDYIWSHRNTLTNNDYPTVTINGKVFDGYTLVPEYVISGSRTEASIGVFCHEFGHVLGLPDSYDTSGATAGVGQWSLMAGGSWGSKGNNSSGTMLGADPSPFMAFELVKLGWLEEENITPAPGKSADYTFDNINNASKVYRINLNEDQYLTLEGKKEDSTGTGMYVMETGLLVTQHHQTVLDKYGGSVNKINYGSRRVHGAMVVEAVAANYKKNGLGDLWRGSGDAYRITTQALFRRDTLTSVGPSGETAKASIPFLPLFFSTIIGSGVVITILLVWYYGRKKLCIAIACAACAACISMSCVVESSGPDGGETYDTGPNTNCYLYIDNVHSKTENSGITIYNIKCNSDGSGSFSVKRSSNGISAE